jgi:hypothetical protein
MGFSLDLEEALRSQDPRTEARLSQWNSPMGRLMHQIEQQHASLMRGSQPGGAAGMGFRLKLQSGLDPELITTSVDTGIELYERAMEVIRWPWADEQRPVLPLEEQLSLLLGRRLEVRSTAGSTDGD